VMGRGQRNSSRSRLKTRPYRVQTVAERTRRGWIHSQGRKLRIVGYLGYKGRQRSGATAIA
ncbi:hypothetical protein IIC38_10960, partial [candidate division KSB1 bacterium]|nr:hypothetical protein [candidate division KSB1 bacterium]